MNDKYILGGLKPYNVFRFFEEICKIPHPTYHTKQISDYLVNFAVERGLKYVQDAVNNVIIYKSSSAGYEGAKPVILQGHVDMVAVKTNESTHDFEKDGLDIYIEDGYIRARGTTLGGDDGAAVALMLALLDDNTIKLPPIEAVFTVDEEVGMEGVASLDLSLLKGRLLINLDSEEEGVFTVGCVGGYRLTVSIPVNRIKVEGTVLTIKISGLLGGHSGVEIHKQRGNAHKIMGRLLGRIKDSGILIESVFGGDKENVISFESTASIYVPDENVDSITSNIKELENELKAELRGVDDGIIIRIANENRQCYVCDKDGTFRVISYLQLCPNGVMVYDNSEIKAPETSLNMGIVNTQNDKVTIVSMIRSMRESAKEELFEKLETLCALCGATATRKNDYPAWQVKEESLLRDKCISVFESLYNKTPKVATMHGGLECGLFYGKNPQFDLISIGPNMLDVHSPNEKLDIESTARTYEFLKVLLSELGKE
ncbi:MAG: aminoacyl-histidine dipeptidase [Lachnospiraceae bacterium]|jgi:dipeptidase D|nr:aminoacyl-histidine dipeptidase [Lachnospiraceae bacterium]